MHAHSTREVVFIRKTEVGTGLNIGADTDAAQKRLYLDALCESVDDCDLADERVDGDAKSARSAHSRKRFPKHLLASVGAAFVLGCAYGGPDTPYKICDNGVDDDGNGLTDCEDPQCANALVCQRVPANPEASVDANPDHVDGTSGDGTANDVRNDAPNDISKDTVVDTVNDTSEDTVNDVSIDTSDDAPDTTEDGAEDGEVDGPQHDGLNDTSEDKG